MPADERPRERLLKYGASSLSAAELLAIVLRTGTKQESAVHLAERVLSAMGSLPAIANAEPRELTQVKGIGTVKAVEMKAAVELGRRLLVEGDAVKPVIHEPDDVAGLLMSRLQHEPQEQFLVILLDTKNHVLKVVTATVGTLDSSLVHPREVFRAAVGAACASVILVHNHPSGDPTPSPQDVEVSKQLVEAGRILGIEVLDHVILGNRRWVSMRKRGLI
ncbi:MAG TPA: DNA repair protein RadC [Armatimonadota bacterium]|jgi:DNA repair protein RadC